MSFKSYLNACYLQLSENEIVGTQEESHNSLMVRTNRTHIKDCTLIPIARKDNRSILTTRTSEMADDVITLVLRIRKRFRYVVYALSEIYGISSLCQGSCMIDCGKGVSLIAFILV
jgi:hypothetical protein